MPTHVETLYYTCLNYLMYQCLTYYTLSVDWDINLSILQGRIQVSTQSKMSRVSKYPLTPLLPDGRPVTPHTLFSLSGYSPVL